MVYTKIKLKNHRKNSVQISIANLKILLKKNPAFCGPLVILALTYIMGKILDILVYNLIKTVCSKSLILRNI